MSETATTPARTIVLMLVSTIGGCVFPSDTPTGIELSWLFLEQEPSDGDDALRVLSCEGVAVESIAVALVDVDDTARQGVFRFDCEAGFQTANDLAREASEAFIELHPRDYDVTVSDDVQGGQTLANRTVEVLERSVTLELWELTRTPVDYELELVNTEACGELALALYYADPERALAEPETNDDGDVVDVLYRNALASDRELGLGGASTACEGLEGTHRFAGLDRGAYRLDVTVDGATCSRLVDLGAGASTVIDVSGMPCG
ncbi:MAG: hypothetical protein IAG13_15185 [Deltaproteobacteria bacterium]|nr:hypothetical protein [Nannocystaceae bacterium]